MSVSLAMIPVALTLRLVMGKENFEKWIESMQERVPTTFESELELMRTVRKAGFDAEKYGGSIKTHIEGEKLFFFWELVEGKWMAVFAKSDSKVRIEQFMAEINRAAGRHIMGQSHVQNELLGLNRATMGINRAPSIFPTNFRDGNLLFKTLKEFGVNPIYQNSIISCHLEQSTLIFRQFQDSPFSVEVQNAPDLHKVFEYLSDVDDDYKRCLQSMVYERLKERVSERNMEIENEEVLEDNSIVLTINIGG